MANFRPTQELVTITYENVNTEVTTVAEQIACERVLVDWEWKLSSPDLLRNVSDKVLTGIRKMGCQSDDSPSSKQQLIKPE